jgi:hypothetical protein
VDGVFEYIRAPILTKYILTRYKPVYYIEPFVLLKKNDENQGYFMSHVGDSKVENIFRERFLSVDFGSIFYIRGFYDNRDIIKESIILHKSNNTFSLNEYLKNNDIYGGSLYLLVKYPNAVSEKGDIKLIDEFDNETNISFRLCKKHYCSIKINEIPLFYGNTRLKEVHSDQKFQNIVLLKNDNI